MKPSGATGCFGKVRCAGDFVTRNLPGVFVARWDAMLQAGVLAGRAALGDAWLPAYLRAPLWRFALGDEVVDGRAWVGVLMPSVDSAGRHFPLTIAAPLGAGAAGLRLDADHPWYARCGALAVAMLRKDASLALLDAGLAALADGSGRAALSEGASVGDGGGPRRAAPSGPAAPSGRSERSEHEEPFHTLAQPCEGVGCGGAASVWWTDGSDAIAPSLRGCIGLPDAAQTKGLFDGDTGGWAWHVSLGDGG